jgi:hypothetical protein
MAAKSRGQANPARLPAMVRELLDLPSERGRAGSAPFTEDFQESHALCDGSRRRPSQEHLQIRLHRTEPERRCRVILLFRAGEVLVGSLCRNLATLARHASGGDVQRGSWFDHTLSWWEHRYLPNVLFLRYEDLLSNFSQELRRIIDFLDYPMDEDVLERITFMARFDNMKKEPFSNMHEIVEFQGFFRKGKIGTWREQFTRAQSEAFDVLYAQKTAGSCLDLNVAGSSCEDFEPRNCADINSKLQAGESHGLLAAIVALAGHQHHRR